MGVLDKILNVMKVSEDDGFDDDEFFDDEVDDFDESTPKKRFFKKQEDDLDDYDLDEKPTSRNSKSFSKQTSSTSRPRSTSSAKTTNSSKISPMRTKKSASGMEVCVIKPTSVEDAREITETLLANRTVVLNLEGLDVDIAQRIIDFTSGSCFAISGNLQKISHYIFIITPASVDISGDFQDIFGGAGSFEMPINNGMS